MIFSLPFKQCLNNVKGIGLVGRETGGIIIESFNRYTNVFSRLSLEKIANGAPESFKGKI